jgi:hypothetical protein
VASSFFFESDYPSDLPLMLRPGLKMQSRGALNDNSFIGSKTTKEGGVSTKGRI